MPLESGERSASPAHGERLRYSAGSAGRPNLSGARTGLTTEGEEPQRFLPLERQEIDVLPRSTELRGPAHRAGRRCRRHHAQDHRRGIARRTRRQGASRRHSRRAVRRRSRTRPRPAAAGRHGGAGAGRVARARRRQHRRGVDDRSGLLRHADPAGAAAQHPRKPGLVHGLHALSAGDQPGPARGAAELPDHGRRPDRSRGGQRLDARRGHRGRRGDDTDASRRARPVEPAGRRRAICTRRPPPCWRPGPSRSASRSSPPTCGRACPTASSSG